MHAIISGQAGLAVFVDSEKAYAVRISALDTDLPCATTDIAYLFADATDVVEFPDITRKEAVGRLRRAWSQDRALQLTLILLDGPAEPETRRSAAKLLDERLRDPEIRVFVENRLYSAPLPRTAELSLPATVQGVTVSEFLRQLSAHQPAIRRCRDAWDLLAPEFFGDDEEKTQFESAALTLGLFRALAQRKLEAFDDSVQQQLRDSELSRFPRAERILQEWIKLSKLRPDWVPKSTPESSGSVTAWLSALQKGDGAALDKLYHRYWPFLVTLARKKLARASAAMDESDIVQSAFLTFFRHVRAAEVPHLANRGELVHQLTGIVARKALTYLRHSRGHKRGSAPERMAPEILENLISDPSPTPEEIAISHDLYEHFLSAVEGRGSDLRPCAEMHIAGWTVPEIAIQMGTSESSVARKLSLVREIWKGMAQKSDSP